MINVHSFMVAAGTQILFAFWFVHLSKTFRQISEHILQDSAVVQDPSGEGQIVYLFLPLYKVSLGTPLH